MPINSGREKIIKYDNKYEIFNLTVNTIIIFSISIIMKPIKIDINKILKNDSFLLNFPENPKTTNPIININTGFNISDK
jgi:hypothetical protein